MAKTRTKNSHKNRRKTMRGGVGETVEKEKGFWDWFRFSTPEEIAEAKAKADAKSVGEKGKIGKGFWDWFRFSTPEEIANAKVAADAKAAADANSSTVKPNGWTFGLWSGGKQRRHSKRRKSSKK